MTREGYIQKAEVSESEQLFFITFLNALRAMPNARRVAIIAGIRQHFCEHCGREYSAANPYKWPCPCTGSE